VLDLAIEVSKKLRRRVVVLHADDRASLGVLPTSAADVLPVAVPRLPPEERVVVEDPSTPAPGADAFRWFFYAANPPWSATRHSLSNVRALQKEFAIKLRNVYSFFTIYANIDGFDPKCESSIVDADRLELERWILGELSMTTREVTARMDEYDVYAATQRLVAFVDALSNWYVRLSRRLFWKGTKIDDADKLSAYETLYRCLVSLTKLTAPFTPYAAEAMYQNLVVRPGVPGARESVHLEDWPEIAGVTERQWAEIETLSNKVAVVRALASLGLQVRNQAKIKVRQPLSEAHVITAHLEALDQSAERQLSREWNVGKTNVVTLGQAGLYVEFRVKPNFRSLGQRGLGKEAQALKRKMASMHSSEAADVASSLMTGETVALDGVDLQRNDVEIEFVAKEGFAAAGERVGVVVLDTRIDERLREQGLLFELINRIQTMRKEMGLEYTDRIRVSVLGSGQVPPVARQFSDLLAEEVLAVHISTTEPVSDDKTGREVREVDVEGETVSLGVALAAFFSPR
jgi:isoleucyl-tRNA synthetase